MNKESIIKLYNKYKAIIIYGIFGVLSTAINIATYFIMYTLLGVPNVPSVLIAWLVAVLFAFITNKLWVFNSKSFESKIFIREMLSFFGGRIATGVLDVVIMYVTVDVLKWDAVVWKVISNIIVIILNYVISKFLVFKSRT